MRGLNPILPDWRDLVRWSDAELAQLDIAVMNLSCAVGLPGSERMDVLRCLKCLDDWALGVREAIEHGLETDFRRNPAEYDNSEPIYRMLRLVGVLQRSCGVRYNPKKIEPQPGDIVRAEDQFIFGAILGPGGTCASLPIVYTAIARRIGYPVYVVWTKGHAFCRWDDPTSGLRVNIEGTRSDGVSAHPDEHYRQWPHPFDAPEEAAMGYLRSLTPREELVSFLRSRSIVWAQAGDRVQTIDALVAMVEADRHPYPRARERLCWFIRGWARLLREQGRIGAGFPCPTTPVEPRRWPVVPWEWEASILALEAAERDTIPRWSLKWDSSGSKPNTRW